MLNNIKSQILAFEDYTGGGVMTEQLGTSKQLG
jgi:hypothetical protein